MQFVNIEDSNKLKKDLKLTDALIRECDRQIKDKTRIKILNRFQSENMLKLDEDSVALDSVIEKMSIGDHEAIQDIKKNQSLSNQNNKENLNSEKDLKASFKMVGFSKINSSSSKRQE